LFIILVAAVTLGSRIARDESSDPSGGVEPTSARATFTASGRGIETDAAVVGLSSVTLQGRTTITIPGSVGEGTDVIQGQATASGSRVGVQGDGITLEAGLLIRPDGVVLDSGAGVFRPSLKTTGQVELLGDEIMFTSGDQTRRYVGSLTFRASGPGDVRFDDQEVRWIDAPKSLSMKDEARTFTSWAGQGTVNVGGRDLSDEFGAIAARDLTAMVERTDESVRLSGTAQAEQVYLDGTPQLITKASVDLVQVREETSSGAELELTWAPRNVGAFDMVMMRISGVGPASSWLSLGLEPAPYEFGGEKRPPMGGRTPGFRRGGTIRSVLPPGDADRRDITVSVPSGTPPGSYVADVLIEGNFPSVSAQFEVILR
jgi:hypothetical protein